MRRVVVATGRPRRKCDGAAGPAAGGPPGPIQPGEPAHVAAKSATVAKHHGRQTGLRSFRKCAFGPSRNAGNGAGDGRPEVLSWTLRNSSGVSEGIHRSVVQSGGEFLYVWGGSHRRRLTRAMASTKVGDGLSYQAAVRWVMGCSCCRRWAAKVVQEKRPSKMGVVRAMARSDHWRRVSR